MVTIYVNTDADGYVTGWGSSSLGEGSILLDVPNDHGFLVSDQLDVWRVVGGEIVKDLAREEEVNQEAEADALRPSTEERLRAAEDMINYLLGL